MEWNQVNSHTGLLSSGLCEGTGWKLRRAKHIFSGKHLTLERCWPHRVCIQRGMLKMKISWLTKTSKLPHLPYQRCLPKTLTVHKHHSTTKFPMGTGSIPVTSQTHKFRWPIHPPMLHSLCTHTSSKIAGVYRE